MGYTTEFSGSIEVTPMLAADDIELLLNFAEERHEGAEFPSIWCEWVPVEEFGRSVNALGQVCWTKTLGAAIGWNGVEKFYSSAEWMKYIIDKFLAPKGYRLNGTIEAQGEDPIDRWRLLVQDNKVLTQQAVVDFLEPMEVSA